MAILNDHEIANLCRTEPPLVSGFLDLDQQLQPAGFDLTLASILRPIGDGVIRAVAGRNVRAKCEPVELDADGYFHLVAGYYVVEFNEVIQLPNDLAAVAYTRSTLIRYGGQLVTGFWDPGFAGKSHCGLVVHSPQGIVVQHKAVLMQMVFHRLPGESGGFQFNHLHEK